MDIQGRMARRKSSDGRKKGNSANKRAAKRANKKHAKAVATRFDFDNA